MKVGRNVTMGGNKVLSKIGGTFTNSAEIGGKLKILSQ